jgi:hypothetical protein
VAQELYQHLPATIHPQHSTTQQESNEKTRVAAPNSQTEASTCRQETESEWSNLEHRQRVKSETRLNRARKSANGENWLWKPSHHYFRRIKPPLLRTKSKSRWGIHEERALTGAGHGKTRNGKAAGGEWKTKDDE